MKSSLLFLAFCVAVFSSCTTAYKSGQTPDDVYYSAAKPQNEYAEAEQEEDRFTGYDDYYYDDRFLRMKVRNRYRWSELETWYGFDRYSTGYNYYFGKYNNPYNSWNYYYNPYCYCPGPSGWVYPSSKTSTPVLKKPMTLSGYSNSGINNSNSKGITKMPAGPTTRPAYNNTNNQSGLSNKVRTILSSDQSGNKSSRSYTPSSSGNSGSGSSSSGKSGSGGSVTRPSRN